MGFVKYGLVALLLLLLRLPATAQAQYTVTHFGTPAGGNSFSPQAINNANQVVGSGAILGGAVHPMLWQSGTYTDLGLTDPGVGMYGLATDINSSGQIVGYCTYGTGTNRHAFLYQGGVMTNISPSGWRDISFIAISNAGLVIAWGTNTGSGNNGFTYDTNTAAYTTFSTSAPRGWRAMNALGQAVGVDDNVTTYPAGTSFSIGTLGGAHTYTFDINAQGQVTGFSQPTSGLDHAFLWTPATPNDSTGKMIDLGSLGGGYSYGRAINCWGHVVGDSYPPSGPTHGFIYKGCSMVDLNSVKPATLTDTILTGIDINDRGQIICELNNAFSGGDHCVLLVPIP